MQKVIAARTDVVIATSRYLSTMSMHKQMTDTDKLDTCAEFQPRHVTGAFNAECNAMSMHAQQTIT